MMERVSVEERDPRRRFGRTERAELYVAADGRCGRCGASLDEGMDADHVLAHSRGGATDVANGQGLCPRCNRAVKRDAKEAHHLVTRQPKTAWGTALRPWQETAMEAWARESAQDPDNLLVAWPGAGKTIFAAKVAHSALADGTVAQVVVVVPSTALKMQIVPIFEAHGIPLHREYVGGPLSTSDFYGVVMTYQQVASMSGILRALIAKTPTLVIMDEIHHAGDDARWGESLKMAFDLAKRRLPMSGTPFRSRRDKIPFVNYDRIGRCRPFYRYSYADAIKEKVCREVAFPMYGGRVEWISRDGRTIQADFFADLESEQQESERLRTALNDADWIGTMIADAHARLMSIRELGHRNAGGLIVAMDQKHAKFIAKVVKKITGHEPPVVVSGETAKETEAALRRIDAFRASSEPWMVAVRMVSEGVDIKRLRVGVYATNVKTHMFFRQFVGRFIRTGEGVECHDQRSYVYVPNDPETAELVRAMRGEAPDIETINVGDEREWKTPEKKDEGEGLNMYRGLWAEARADGIYFGERLIGAEELDSIRADLAKNNLHVGLDVLAATRVLAMGGELKMPERPDESVLAPQYVATTSSDRLTTLRRHNQRLATKLAADNHLEPRMVNHGLKTVMGFATGEASIADLERRATYIIAAIDAGMPRELQDAIREYVEGERSA